MDRIAPGGRQIVKVSVQFRIYCRVDVFTPATEMQHAWAGNGHFRLGISANTFQIAEIFQHRMIAKAQFSGDTHAVSLSLNAVKLDALV
ncbi:hypothetical protein D3C71_1689230 [compost metagenome]